MTTSRSIPRAPHVYPIFRDGIFLGYQAQVRVYADRFTVAERTSRFFNVKEQSVAAALEAARRWAAKERRRLGVGAAKPKPKPKAKQGARKAAARHRARVRTASSSTSGASRKQAR